MKDPKIRFGDRVDDYKKYRPSYPAEALMYVKEKCKIDKTWNVADIGSGTGISTRALLDCFQCNVFAVEPNANMRMQAEETLSDNVFFHSVDGSSEQTNLGNHSVNMAAAFQAFHWFDMQKSKLEFKSILTEPSWVLLIWNDRITNGSDFLEGYEKNLKALPEYSTVNHKNVEKKVIEDFMGTTEVIYQEFPNSQRFDFNGLKGRFFSSSYTPAVGTMEYQQQIEKLEHLFTATNRDGQIEILYKTQIYLGRLR